jgi:hypothetical protein
MGDKEDVSADVEPSTVDEIIGRMPFPGTEQYFVFTTDTFPQPMEASHKLQTAELLGSFLSHKTQLAFSVAKGSIPAVDKALDALKEPQEEDQPQPGFPTSWMLQAGEDFKNLDKVLATSGWFPSFISEARLRDALVDLIAPNADVEAEITNVLDLLESNLYLFRYWQDGWESCNLGAE